MTYLAVSIFAKNEDDFFRQLDCAKGKGAEAVEIRVDALTQPGVESVLKMVRAAQKAKLPVIVTCRDKKEGGFNEVAPSLCLSILRESILAGAEFVDIEYANFKCPDTHSVLKAAIEQSETKLILSSHNFDRPFEELDILYESILAVYPDAIPKIVYKARHINDCFAAFDLLRDTDRPLICFCMGAAGQISRILAKKFGAFLTFASLDDDSATAPGQVPVERMKLFAWDRQDADTEIFGLIGNPVAHSLGPALYNACFDAEKINAVYLPFWVEGDREEFDAFLDCVSERCKFGFGGFSVTLPHKTHALDYANQHGDYVDNLAEAIGAVNTLKIGFNGLLSAYNTDYAGAMDALAGAMGAGRHDLHKSKVAVVGAGGVARAVVAGLADVGARVTIYNRTLSKAESLAKEFGCKFASIDELAQTKATILVNCTSLGMHPNVETSPVPEGVLHKNMIVFDTVYNPLQTKLLTDAKAIGATAVNGAEMFIRQAMAQYKIYIGDEPDEELMRKVVYESLSSSV
ncbi:MAG: shikimate dehydrogenase [Planctomycetales bacterium 4572_13]|nr:MAG: shikimate dehydrogenase [Planctomycetales bacterium 4572_13]